VHVSVDFSRPRHADLERLARELRALDGKPVLVHCQLNMRASVFVFLYRVTELGEDPERAYDDVLKVWQPNAVWNRFAREELQARGIRVPLAAD
jgi:3-mercaptopyruvate sulfurtransferase SseA